MTNKKTMHDSIEIKSDINITQMIKRWKKTQLLHPSVQYEQSRDKKNSIKTKDLPFLKIYRTYTYFFKI